MTRLLSLALTLCLIAGAAWAQATHVGPNVPGAAPGIDCPGTLGVNTGGCTAIGPFVAGGTATNNAATAGNIGEYKSVAADTSSATVTISNASPGVVTWASNTLTDLSPVYFTTTGGLPTGLSVNTTYWVIGSTISGNNFSVATSIANAIAGTAVNTSSAGSGTHTGRAAAFMSTGAAKSVMALNLTAGDWDCRGTGRLGGLATGITQFNAALTGTLDSVAVTGTTEQPFVALAHTFTDSNSVLVPAGTARFSLSSTTPIYLGEAFAFSGGTGAGAGSLACRRVR